MRAFIWRSVLWGDLLYGDRRNCLCWLVHSSKRWDMGCLYAHDGIKITLSFKLEFLCSNNEAEYESLVMGLSLPYRWEFVGFKVQGDSMLIIKQVNRKFPPKENALMTYRTVEKLISSLVSSSSMCRECTISRCISHFFKIDVSNEASDLRIVKNTFKWTWFLVILLMNKIGALPSYSIWFNYLQLWLRRTWKTSLLLTANSNSR